MSQPRNPSRSYHSPHREEAATKTRLAIVRAGQHLFTSHGWAATTMRAIAEAAGVSVKTVEALFGTKATLLEEVVRFAIRGDLEDIEMPQRQAVARIEGAPDARTMLALHAAHLRAVNERSAGLAWTIEQAVPSDPAVADLWNQMNRNRKYAVGWATSTLLVKPGRRPRLRRRLVEATFWVALDWATYRTLTAHAGLSAGGYEEWLREYYASTLLAR
jgi:TetR/AcrR family transcriptional regulator, regulator of autoinduction and epiphytic fitness